jgi:hypothetical protein
MRISVVTMKAYLPPRNRGTKKNTAEMLIVNAKKQDSVSQCLRGGTLS